MSETSAERSILKPRAYKFALAVINFIDQLNRKDFTIETIAKQLVRSATSIGANIVEAQSASSTKDFINFYTHALKSANETKFWLQLLSDSNKAANIKFENEKLLAETAELAKMLASSIISLKSKNS